MKQWDWEGNQGIDPYSLGCYSKKKCPGYAPEHGSVGCHAMGEGTLGSGCPECGRQQRFGSTTARVLKDEMPGVYAELHPNKNSGVDTEKLTCGSAKRVWWLCQSNHSRPEGCQHEHKWEARVQSAAAGLRKPSGCPFCSGCLVCPCKSLAELQPALLQYLGLAGNAVPLAEPLDPSWLGVTSSRKVWWRHECAEGQVGHWTATVHNVSWHFKATGQVPCPLCGPTRRAATFAERRSKLIKRN